MSFILSFAARYLGYAKKLSEVLAQRLNANIREKLMQPLTAPRDVECYVLNDPQKTAVISQRGMGEALGFPKEGSGKQFLRILQLALCLLTGC
jgi:hypothetical protein